LLATKFFVYLAYGATVEPRVEISGNLRIDALILGRDAYSEFRIITPGVPLWLAEKALLQLKTIKPDKLFKEFERVGVRFLREFSPQIRFSLENLKVAELIEQTPDLEIPEIDFLFWGRSLLATEAPELLRAGGYDPPWDPEDWLQALYLQKRIIREAAVGIDRLGTPYCRRCGSTVGIVKDDCFFCGNRECLTCTNCETMGLAKSCIPLYSMAYPGDRPRRPEAIQPVLDFELAPPQRRAYHNLEKFAESRAKHFLVWAVCGGGKTEVSFGIIARILSEGGRILFAIPRREIVIELQPRFAKAFPGVVITALYGGGGERFADSEITIATTHQCLRFYSAFDLVVLDEADAFPYQGNAMLRRAVERSLKPDGRMVIMTATPDKSLIDRALKGKMPYVSIPARYHRNPLALPEIIKVNLGGGITADHPWRPPQIVAELILAAAGRRPLLIFMPTIKLLESIGRELVRWGLDNQLRGAVTHSRNDNRSDVKEQLLTGALNFLVTSTIFERGITIPDLEVMVLWADYEGVFDCRTLVQICGRVGRRGERGHAYLIAKNESPAMRECRKWIAGMNREAFELGFIDNIF